MELRQLRYFEAVAREGNFSRAAERCFVSQPSLSQQIINLEKELGEVLFIRARGRVKLTGAGELLRPRARAILAGVSDAEQTFKEREALATESVSFGVIPTVAPYFLPQLLATFHNTYPRARIDIVEGKTTEIVGQVTAGTLCFAVVSNLGQPVRGLQTETLLMEKLVLAVPGTHALAEQPTITSADLSQEPFLVLKDGHCLKDQVLETCRSYELNPLQTVRCEQLSTLMTLVASGLGVSFVPEMAARSRPSEGVVFREVAGLTPSRQINLATSIHEPPDGLVGALVALLKRSATELGG